jgi:alpha-glucosidase
VVVSEFLWWRDGVIYQIYPRSYKDSNQDGIGDLPGITEKLNYLKDLGVDAIWLSPVYPSPDVDFGYDISDYREIDPRYGGMEAFDNFISEAHARNIHVIIDLVLNHTSNQHPWFQQSRSSKENSFRDWYIWRSSQNRSKLPNNWKSRFGNSGWAWDEKTEEYYFHMFFKEQPDLNWRNPKVVQEILDMVKFWLDKGVDGFRLDVFNAYFKDIDFKDNPSKIGLTKFDQQKHLYDIDQPEMFDFLREFRVLLDSYPQRYAVGETFMGDHQTAADYTGDQALHAAFDFSFQNNRYNPAAFYRTIQRWENVLDQKGWPNYFLNNHDVIRSASRYTKSEDDDRLKVLATLLLTLRGTPFIYYGEEIGMRDIPITKKANVLDPVGRHFWPFYKGRDGCRSPMQWNDDQNAGFSTGNPWLPVHSNYGWRNVETQSSNPESLLNFYKQLIKIRKTHPVFQNGMYLPITFEPHKLLAFIRQSSDQTALIALNFSKRSVGLVLSSQLLGSDWKLLISNKRDTFPIVRDRKIMLEGNEALVLING